MTASGPWYLSARAVREYGRLARLDTSTDDGFDRAAMALQEYVAQAHHVRDQDNGLQLWRGPRPLRLRLLVSTATRREGPLPQLVTVLPASARGPRR